MHRIQILLVGDDVLLRDALGRLLDQEADLSLAGACESVPEALEALKRASVDLVVLESSAGTETAHALVREARAGGYSGTFLLIAAGLNPQWSVKALKLGVSGIFLRSRGLEKLLRAIRLVASGEAWMEPEIVRALANQAGEPLTEREQQVFSGVLDGLTNRTIAERLGVSEASVKAALRRIFRRRGVQSRSQLIRAALSGSLER